MKDIEKRMYVLAQADKIKNNVKPIPGLGTATITLSLLPCSDYWTLDQLCQTQIEHRADVVAQNQRGCIHFNRKSPNKYV